MNDARLGIVRLLLPDGREVALSLTFQRLDAVGPAGINELFQRVSKGKVGSALARAELLELFSDGAITVADVKDRPVAFPVIETTQALWRAWEISQYGPDGRPAEDGPANPRNRPPTWWGNAFKQLFGRG